MFRKGGVLAEDYVPVADCGSGSPMCVCSGGGGDPPCCSISSMPMCNQLLVYEWQNAAVGDQVAVFDEVFTYETAAESRVITAISDPWDHGLLKVTLNLGLGRTFAASERYEPSSGEYRPIFTNEHSAGFGVISDCDIAPNQINQTTPVESCFYDADMRGLERPFGDGFVEFFAPRDGMSVLPFIPEAWFSVSGVSMTGLTYLSRAWFEHYFSRENYLHLLGATGLIKQTNQGPVHVLGRTISAADYTYIFAQRAEEYGDLLGATEQQVHFLRQHTLVHETGHQFDVNICGPEDDDFHDNREAWCGDHCEPGVVETRKCVMGAEVSNDIDDWDGVNRFCKEDLFVGAPECPPLGAIRREADPVKDSEEGP